MREHSVERRRSLTRLSVLAFGFSALALGVACSDDAGSSSNAPSDVSTTLDPTSAARTTTTLKLDTPTTFIANCSQMPDVAAISAIVGIPLADGQVVAAGTCQYIGLNEQTRVITLSLFSDPVDQATFNDLELSLGASAALNDPALPNALVDPSSLVYLNANGVIYTVRTMITDATPAEQVPLSAAVLRLWLGV
ncbi:MAG: hypothetical protein K8R99_14270 [Actinomycetia bacterium]|nr:hypothetical protein [Actinomycetes bacterium]